ncbi:GDP-mannose 4,6-dehydratase [Marinactinospora thermotolerans]|uniref:GDP-mannose 4,6-dehydratase n=2 Tax=Marinactinospora thermotolerans TaxID=531310 RepID=A0A1T4T4D7_9ACTN|nr:GDP-D-manose-4,6-dehydratase [Marinactinospora thermotolerans]SKA35257.1 GDPmannose 4,6-dehydratase [Marinactinospora thermotolerans DSM 45154]
MHDAFKGDPLSKRALITGITGQDGSYLAEHLLGEGYRVWGLVRGQDSPRKPWIRPLLKDIGLVQGDLLDQKSLTTAIDQVQPDEVYNLGAISYVPLSWKQPQITAEVTGLGVLRLLEAMRTVLGATGNGPRHQDMRFYQASSSEMFGKVREEPQNELTGFHPRSPYAVAKTYGHYITQNYRESFGMHCVSGILFNHESPRRGPEFVTRKITLGVARIKLGLDDHLRLGNLEARRDWGFAGDYVRAMHLMVRSDTPKDYVIGTGRTHSVRDVVETAFAAAGLDWRAHVLVDQDLIRPAEVDTLRADSTLARRELGWQARVGFEELVRMMVESDLRSVAQAKSGSPDVEGLFGAVS